MGQKTYRKRPLRIDVYVSKDELDKVKLNAKEAGLSVGEYTRKLYNGDRIVVAPTADTLELIRQVKRVGSNLDQLLHKLNAFGIAHGPELDECINQVRETIRVIYQAYESEKGGE